VPGTIPLYRYWGNNNHFYTTNINEIGTGTPGTVGNHGYKSEGVAGYCYSSDQGSGTVPLYRFFHFERIDHFYTTSKSEGDAAEGWTYEGIQCYVPTPEPTPYPTGTPTKSPTDSPTREPTDAAVPFYRYYHSGIVDHFYERNWNALGTGKYGWAYQGVACNIYPSQVPGTIPLYRYWGNNNHFYTTNINEIGTGTPGTVGNHGYKSEGVAGYCYSSDQGSGTVPLYRFFHFERIDHFYTTSKSEGDAAEGWTYEGIQCYVPK